MKRTASYHPHPELGHRVCGVGPLPEPFGSEDTSEPRAQQHDVPVFHDRYDPRGFLYDRLSLLFSNFLRKFIAVFCDFVATDSSLPRSPAEAAGAPASGAWVAPHHYMALGAHGGQLIPKNSQAGQEYAAFMEKLYKKYEYMTPVKVRNGI